MVSIYFVPLKKGKSFGSDVGFRGWGPLLSPLPTMHDQARCQSISGMHPAALALNPPKILTLRSRKRRRERERERDRERQMDNLKLGDAAVIL